MIWNASNLVLRLGASAILWQAYSAHPFWMTQMLFYGNLILFAVWLMIAAKDFFKKPVRKVYRG